MSVQLRARHENFVRPRNKRKICMFANHLPCSNYTGKVFTTHAGTNFCLKTKYTLGGTKRREYILTRILKTFDGK